MMESRPFKGQITIYHRMGTSKRSSKAKGTKILSFDLEEPKAKQSFFDDTLMNQFQFLDLSVCEKRELTRDHRRLLAKLKNLCPKKIGKYAAELGQALAQEKQGTLTIWAEGVGAFICLAAILHKKIPQNKKIQFVFESSPLKFFPKELLKKNKNKQLASEQFEILHILEKDHCLSPFKSLFNCHESFDISHHIESKVA